MAVHKLVLDEVFEDVNCTLIAIHCNIEDYRLAYLLNKNLNISLSRKKEDLDFDKGTTKYSVYEYKEIEKLIIWNLVSNISKIEIKTKLEDTSLFNLNHTTIKTYNLIPEYGKANYFLKIDTEFSNTKIKNTINSILRIPQIAIAYNVDMQSLKSKEHLIFN